MKVDGVLQSEPGGHLVVQRHDGDTAADALARLTDPVAIGWSPRWAGFVVGEPPAALYELRAFDGTSELRWYRDPDGTSRTVVLCEGANGAQGSADEGIEFERRITGGTMLVWGTGTGGNAVGARQVGELPTPVPVPEGNSLGIEMVEYIGRDPLSGTATVIEERLVRVVEAPARQEGT